MDSDRIILTLLVALVYLLLAAGPFVILWWGWQWLSRALLREERARCFLGLLELGLGEGRAAEQIVLSLTAAGVSELGKDFSVLAQSIRQGKRLGNALEEVPEFLPTRVCAMLRVGEELGDLRKVLPAAQSLDAAAAKGTTRTITNNLMVLLFVSPVGPLLLSFLAIWVFPKLNMIALDMLPGGSAWSPTLLEISMTIAWIITGLWLLLVFGNGFKQFLHRLHSTLPDAMDYRLSWRRKRMMRDFSMMLALLLDAGLSETRAIDLAAACAANARFRAQADRARRELENGANLTDAIRVFDHADEFIWRLRNAALPSAKFVDALAGWHESLAAKAFQQQQTASQLVTTGFVLLNGVMVALVALGLFELLIAIFEEAAL